MKLALFDYGAGNLHSLGKALEGSGANVVVTADWAEALSFDGIVLPGVGAFGHAARALPADRSRIRGALEAGLPCLGICLGMQLLFDESDESAGTGIGLVPGRVSRVRAAIVPQMGWNDVEVTSDPIFAGIQGAGELLRELLRLRAHRGVRYHRVVGVRRCSLHRCRTPRQHVGHAVPP